MVNISITHHFFAILLEYKLTKARYTSSFINLKTFQLLKL